MDSSLEKSIKLVEQELTDLKTASEYTSVRSANFRSGYKVSVGLYKLTFASSYDILSMVYCSDASGMWGSGNIYARTPIGNTQIVEVGYSEFIIPGSETETVPMVVISNTPVISLEKIA